MAGKTQTDFALLKSLCDGKRSSREIASVVGCHYKTVKRLMKKHDLPRRKPGHRSSVAGSNNPMYKTGRIIDHDGYARTLNKLGQRVLEHRNVVENHIGRNLFPFEVVDHIDGLTLHNNYDNLRVFQSNKEHLKATLSSPVHSMSGIAVCRSTYHQRKDLERVDTFGLRRKRGDVRLRQILLAALKFGIDSRYLLGAYHHLEKNKIDYFSRQGLELAYSALLRRYEQDLLR